MKSRFWGVILAAPVFVLTVNAKSATLFDQQVDPSLSGAFSEFDGQHIADDFQLTAQSTLETISWAGYYETPQTVGNPVSFKIRFFNDNGGTPSLPLNTFLEEYNVAVNAVETGDIVAGPAGDPTPLLTYTFSLPSLTLGPGEYWVSVLEADTRTPQFHPNEWLWSRSDPLGVGGFAFRGGDLDTWSAGLVQGNMAFTLTGTAVPIPATVWLFGSGLLGLVGIARKKKAA